jgi:hypothetical protein
MTDPATHPASVAAMTAAEQAEYVALALALSAEEWAAPSRRGW